MRLRDILVIINESFPTIQRIKFTNENGVYKIQNVSNLHKHFYKLAEIEAFIEDIRLLLTKHAYLITDQNVVYTNFDMYNECKEMVDEIKYKCLTINNLLLQTVKPQNENTISFKLYKFDNFNDYINFCNDLNKVILAPLKRLNIDIQLGELETGSNWLSIICQVGLGVILLTAIVRQAFDILIHDYQKYNVADKIIESFQMEKEFIESYNKKMLDQKEREKDEKVKQIVNDIRASDGFPQIDDGELYEFTNAVKLSIDMMGKHIDKGLEIYQVLDKKENERYKLPDFSKLIELKQPQKLITNNTEKDESNSVLSTEEQKKNP